MVEKAENDDDDDITTYNFHVGNFIENIQTQNAFSCGLISDKLASLLILKDNSWHILFYSFSHSKI